MKLISTILPSLLVGGLLFGSAAGIAGPGTPVPPPTPPTAPLPPKPPKPPKVSKAGSGFTVNIHDGKVQIDGLDDMVDSQIDGALKAVAGNPGIPPAVRDKVVKRLEKVRAKVKARIAHIDTNNVDQLGEELGKLGEEIGDEMEEFGSDMDKFGKDMDEWGKQFEKNFGKDFAKKFGNVNVHVDRQADDDDDDDDIPGAPDDDDDIDVDAVRDLGTLNLTQPQRDQLKKLRADSDAKVATAKRELQKASENLEKQLANPGASNADIERSIDAVAQQEAAIRKARILAWVNARNMLDAGQRKKVETAKGRSH